MAQADKLPYGDHPAMRYAAGVLNGEIVACNWVRLAVTRHLTDLLDGEARGLHFEADAAQHVIDFFGFLKHSKGEWAGTTVTLEPWQQFYLWVLFGWQREDGTRRFRTAYQEVARKNGKTTIAAGVGLYLFDADEEPGAEIYTAATKRDQARIAHSEATRMVKASPFLRKRIGTFKDNLHIKGTASKFEPLGRDSDSMDGLNVHGAIIDEVHAHKSRDVWDLLDTATGSRRQPLMFGITTAGFDRQSLCYELHTYTEQVLNGVIVDDSFFGVIYTLDEEDDWEDEAVWVKANPNLGVSKKRDDMQRKAQRAKEMPSALNNFIRLELNVWTQSVTKWMKADKWASCAGYVDADGLSGRICYAGLDLSTTTDITAFVLVFPPQSEDDAYQVLCRFWVPEESMRQRTRRDRVPYEAWVRQGLVTATPGEVLDYAYVLDQIDQDAQRYDLAEIAFDRWGASQVSQGLEQNGLTMVQFGQGFASMSPAMKELERLVIAGQLAHGGNPVLTWMADNLVARVDPAGNIKPDKERSTEKIDGMVALIMGLDRAVRHAPSVYEESGVKTL
jgi:phage terminase large subunit-like protein